MSARASRLSAGGVLLLAAGLSLLTRLSAIRASHPALLATLLACALLGGLLVLSGLRTGEARGGARRVTARIAGLLAAFGLAAGLVWLRPFTATEPARDALLSDAAVVVRESATRITLRRAGRAWDAGATLVFIPGARVDPRAYARPLRAVASAGFPVVVVKPPFGVGLLARGAAMGELDAAARGGRPVAVGGHSLGGTSAALVVRDRPATDGLLLWASFPAGDELAGRGGLRVASISGTRDGLATPQDIADSRADLPADSVFTAVPGALHADFGDYGEQRGDGDRATGHDAAQGAIVAATLRFLRALARGG